MMNKPYRSIVDFDSETYSKIYKDHGECSVCHLWGRRYGIKPDEFVCQDCFEDKHLSLINLGKILNLEKLSRKRRDAKFLETIKKRVEKGWSPIRFRT